MKNKYLKFLSPLERVFKKYAIHNAILGSYIAILGFILGLVSLTFAGLIWTVMGLTFQVLSDNTTLIDLNKRLEILESEESIGD